MDSWSDIIAEVRAVVHVWMHFWTPSRYVHKFPPNLCSWDDTTWLCSVRKCTYCGKVELKEIGELSDGKWHDMEKCYERFEHENWDIKRTVGNHFEQKDRV